MGGLLFLKGIVKKTIYKRWSLDLLEVSCYMNVLCFSLATLFALVGNRDETVIAYVSGSVIMLEFLIVICASFLMKVCDKDVWNKWKQRMQPIDITFHEAEELITVNEITYSELPSPTNESTLTEDKDLHKDGDNSESNVPYNLMK